MKRGEIKSDLAWATPTKVVVQGHDLCEEIVGKIDLGQMAFLEFFGRLPTENEDRIFNAMMVILVEHGITPSSLATRMTYAGAPEAVQASVAAGLLGLGSVFVGSIDGAAKLLQEAVPDPSEPADLAEKASAIVTAHRSRRELIPGLGHPFHKPVDPRTEALFKVARETGFDGPYVQLMTLIAGEAGRQAGREIPLNVTGAMAAIASELRLPWRASRGLAVAARAVGLVGHILEEMRQPMADEIYMRIEDEASAHLRPIVG